MNIFEQIIRQLANLAHTTSPSQPNFDHYYRILKNFAEAKIGIVLVDLVQTGALAHHHIGSDDDDNDDNNNTHVEGTVGDAESESEEQPSRSRQRHRRRRRQSRLSMASSQKEHHQSPLELLVDLFRTMLSLLRHQHPHDVKEQVYESISACLQHYAIGAAPPLVLIEEILKALGQGATTTILQHPVGGKASAKPKPVEVPNPTYAVARQLIANNMGRLSTPISTLLNGVINGESHIVENSSLTAEAEESEESQHGKAFNVWDIIYELHRISSDILTTVIGTVSSSSGLGSLEDSKRHRVVQLLGKIFVTDRSKCAGQYRPCFRDWLKRIQDPHRPIRLEMITFLIRIIQRAEEEDIVEEADKSLAHLIEFDPEIEVRRQAIHQACDFIFEHSPKARVSLLKSIGTRCAAKNKEERRDSLTGLAQIYWRNFIRIRLRNVQEAGEDCDISIVQQILGKNCDFTCQKTPERKRKRSKTFIDQNEKDQNDVDIEKEKYGWIPSTVFEAFCFNSQDPILTSRCIQIVDELLLGSEMKSARSKHLTPTARAGKCLRFFSSSALIN